jgi:hypothetical protein
MYITISIALLALIAIFSFIVRKHKEPQKFTPLAGLAFGFVLAALFTGGDRLIGYSLFGIGIILSVIDIVRKMKPKQ